MPKRTSNTGGEWLGRTRNSLAGGEWLGYAAGATLLMVGGFFLTTPILNWICGPLLIVLSVVVTGRLQDRRRNELR